MRQVHVAQDLAEAYLVQGVLHAAFIDASVRGEHITADGGVRPAEAEMRPSVWVGDADAPRARAVIREYLGDDRPGEALLGLAEAVDDATRIGRRPDHHDLNYEDAVAADVSAQRAMGDLFLATDGLAHDPGRGDLLDEVDRLGAFVAETAAPFGVDAATWERIAQLSTAVLAASAAADDDRVQQSARELRTFLRPLV